MHCRLRASLLASTVVVGFLAASSVAAQDSNRDQRDRLPTAGQLPPNESGQVAPAADGAATTDIVVTGSRIAGNAISNSPIQVTDAQAIASTGASNLQDVLLQNPVFGTPSISRTNSNFSTSGAGLATIDLRNLGTARTLVLVNGRRFVSGLPNDQAVDLNTIPTTFVDRVDILTGGASSIYGSDAVAGVVNIIYKNNFSGVEANIQNGISDRGDGYSRQANLTIGTNFGDDGKGNIVAYVGYSDDGPVFSRDRARSAIDQISTGGGVTSVIDDIFSLTKPYYSSYAPQGRYIAGGNVYTFGPNGNLLNGFVTNGSATRAPDGFNRSAYRTISIPVERYLLATRASYQVSSALNLYLEGTFAKTHTNTNLEPFAISTAGTNGIFQGTGGYFPVEQRLADGTLFANPYIPAGLLSKTTDVNGDGLRDISFNRRLTDIGDRTSTADRTTFRIVAGANGDLSSNFKYDAFFNYGRTDDNQTGTGQVNLANFRYALAVIPATPGSAGSVTLPNGTAIACADVNARAQGCVPANVFGANTLSSAAAGYIRADSNRKAYADQLDIGVNLSGKLFDPFGAGPIGVAVGGEYRREASAAAFDALSQAGLNGGNAIPNTSGRFNVKEGYAELRVPIIRDGFIKELSLDGAGRVSNYSTIGTVWSWNGGGHITPFEGLTLRAERARATRAPNVGELYTGPSQTFPTGLIDPCVGVTATTAGVLGTFCRAAPGVNANIAANGKFVQNQSDVQGVSGFDSGNPLLRQEVGDTLTFGAVINPGSFGFLRNLSVTVDYTQTRIKNAIVSTPRQFILNQCYNQGIQSFCQFVTRRAAAEGANSPGSLQFINSAATNSGGVFTNAIDATANYLQDLRGVGIDGKLSLGVTYTHLIKGYTTPLPGAEIDPFAGEVGASKNRFLATAGITIGGLRLLYRGNYIGPAYLDDKFVLSLTDAAGNAITDAHDPRAKISARYYSSLQAQYLVGRHFEFYVGVNNLTDVAPPPIYSGLPEDVTGTETDAGTYDAVGRSYYAGIRLKF